MAYNGTGTFQRIYSWAVDAANGILVRSDRMDTEMDGFATGLSNCITKDGQQTVIANIPFAGYKITGLGNGSAPADSVNYAQVFVAPSFTGGITFSGGAVGTGVINFSGATSVSVPTPTSGDSSTNAATTAFVQSVAFSAALPAISATTKGKSIGNDGSVADWYKIVASFPATTTAGGF